MLLCVFFLPRQAGRSTGVQGKALVFTGVETAALASTSSYNRLNENAGDQWKDQAFSLWTGS